MSEPELPGLGLALAWVLIGLPFLVSALRRAAQSLPRRSAPTPRFMNGELLAVVATPFLALLAISALLGPQDSAAEPSGASILVALAGTQFVLGTAAGLAVVFARRHPGGLAALGFAARFPPRTFRMLVAVYVPGFVVLNLGIGIAWAHLCLYEGWEERQEILGLIERLGGFQWVLAALLAVWIGPFVEELFFRGFVQGALERLVGERSALVLTSLVFARLHGMAGLPVLFGLSLFLGWLQQRTRCLWVPWSVHALNNAVSLGLALALGSR